MNLQTASAFARRELIVSLTILRAPDGQDVLARRLWNLEQHCKRLDEARRLGCDIPWYDEAKALAQIAGIRKALREYH